MVMGLEALEWLARDGGCEVGETAGGEVGVSEGDVGHVEFGSRTF
jgi:hypothetical protein